MPQGRQRTFNKPHLRRAATRIQVRIMLGPISHSFPPSSPVEEGRSCNEERRRWLSIPRRCGTLQSTDARARLADYLYVGGSHATQTALLDARTRDNGSEKRHGMVKHGEAYARALPRRIQLACGGVLVGSHGVVSPSRSIRFDGYVSRTYSIFKDPGTPGSGKSGTPWDRLRHVPCLTITPAITP
jgi:hypothetical protein